MSTVRCGGPRAGAGSYPGSPGRAVAGQLRPRPPTPPPGGGRRAGASSCGVGVPWGGVKVAGGAPGFGDGVHLSAPGDAARDAQVVQGTGRGGG